MWTNFSALFVTSKGRVTASVPNSCIESAEFVIQSIYHGMRLNWSQGQERTPHVIAEFGAGVTIDVTAAVNLQNQGGGLTDFAFKGLPVVGEGLICLNKSKNDLGYNMHLGAIVASDPGKALVSNMMEPVGMSVQMKTLEAVAINTPGEFRSAAFGSSSKHYALGILRHG